GPHRRARQRQMQLPMPKGALSISCSFSSVSSPLPKLPDQPHLTAHAVEWSQRKTRRAVCKAHGAFDDQVLAKVAGWALICKCAQGRTNCRPRIPAQILALDGKRRREREEKHGIACAIEDVTNVALEIEIGAATEQRMIIGVEIGRVVTERVIARILT